MSMSGNDMVFKLRIHIRLPDHFVFRLLPLQQHSNHQYFVSDRVSLVSVRIRVYILHENEMEIYRVAL
jgi:hypothetical protein